MLKKQILNDFKSSKKSINSTIEIGRLLLINNGIKNGESEIKWYLQKLYNCSSIELYNIKDEKISNTNFNKILIFLINRLNNIPFQHLIGCAPFYGRDFFVNNNVLIPRQESEILINVLKNKNQCKMLDIGTGSGCLAITSILEGIAKEVDAVDINKGALILAKKNSISLNAKNINYIKMNILEETPNDRYDIIISNPPYISKDEYKELDLGVKDNEPQEALTDMKDGYTFYNRYADILKKTLKKSGIAIFELSHFFNKQKIKLIFKDFSNIKFYKDLNNDLRAVAISND